MLPSAVVRARFALLTCLVAFVATSVARCARPQCQLNSDCGPRRYCSADNVCLQDCAENRDCGDGEACNPNGRCVPASTVDAATPDDAAPDVASEPAPVEPPPDVAQPDIAPPPPDRPPPPPDIPPPPDVTPPPPDGTPPPPDRPAPDVARPTGAYLDPCTSTADCQSGDCHPTAGGAFCTRSCTSRRDCGDGYVCSIPAGSASGRCVPDDTGARCDPTSSAVSCARFCFGNSVSRVGHCTRECAGGRDCPAGFACSLVSGTSVCVEIERPCARAADCPSNFCLGPAGSSFRGCTSQCRSAADCPPRMVIEDGGRLLALPAYTCQNVEGVNLCVPPITGIIAGGDVLGSDAMGATCDPNPGARVLCRSGVCDGEAPPVCVQACTPSGGCPSGFACRTWLPDGPTGSVYLVCRPAGSGAVGTRCARGGDCATALCLGDYCTRFCNDGVCPTGMRCTPAGSAVGGVAVSICMR